MLNKILIWAWSVLSLIFLIENAVQPIPYVLLWPSSTMFLSLMSTLVWIWIWLGIKWILVWWNEKEDDNLDF